MAFVYTSRQANAQGSKAMYWYCRHLQCSRNCQSEWRHCRQILLCLSQPLSLASPFGFLLRYTMLHTLHKLLLTSDQGPAAFQEVKGYSPLVDCIMQGLADPAGRVSNDAPGLQIALALGASVYLLTDKKRVPRGTHMQAELCC